MKIADLNALLIAHNSSPELPSLRELVLSFVVPPSGGSSATEAQLRTTAALEDALFEIKAGSFPDLVIVYQGVPDEFPQSQIDELIGLLPLARFIVAFSPWCESIGRTEQRWPIAWCVPIRHARTRLVEEITALRGGEPASPPTTSRDEAFSACASRFNQAVISELEFCAVVLGTDQNFVEMTRELLGQLDATIVTERSTQPDFVFFSATMLSQDVLRQLANLREEFPNSQRILVSDLLTPGEIKRLQRTGFQTMSQPRFVDDLLVELRHA